MGINRHCNLLLNIILISLLLLVTSCGKPKGDPNISSLGGSPFSSIGQPVRWSSSTLAAPLDLGITQAFIDDIPTAQNDEFGDDLFEQSMKEWDGAMSTINFFKIPATILANKSYSTLGQYRDSELGIYKSFDWFPTVPSGALAITQFFGIRINPGTSDEYLELTHADIIVNYRDFTYSYDPGNINQYDLASVVLHELGHFLGLGHQTDSQVNSVMQPYISTFESNRIPFGADQNTLLDLYTTSGTSPFMGYQVHSMATPQSSNRVVGEEVQGIFELRADGECRHYINNKFIKSHISAHKLK
jgi:hypothetical protein